MTTMSNVSVKMYCVRCREDFIAHDVKPMVIQTKRGERHAVSAIHSCGTKSIKFVKKPE